MTDIKQRPDERSDRSIPLNVESVMLENARRRKVNNPTDEAEKLKDDGSDTETIRGDIESEDTGPINKPKPKQ